MNIIYITYSEKEEIIINNILMPHIKTQVISYNLLSKITLYAQHKKQNKKASIKKYLLQAAQSLHFEQSKGDYTIKNNYIVYIKALYINNKIIISSYQGCSLILLLNEISGKTMYIGTAIYYGNRIYPNSIFQKTKIKFHVINKEILSAHHNKFINNIHEMIINNNIMGYIKHIHGNSISDITTFPVIPYSLLYYYITFTH